MIHSTRKNKKIKAMQQEIFWRIASSVVLSPIVIGAIIFGGVWLKTFLYSILILMLLEWTKISHKKSLLSFAGILYMAGAMLFWILKPTYSYMLLYVFPLVWINDISAYFFGKVIGGAKLAPKISPNKTWSGAIAGFFASVLLYFCFAKIFRFSLSITGLVVTTVLAVLSILGDLLESKVKRMLNVKDTGNIIPGHGGILDRMDSFLAVTWGIIIINYFF